MINRVKKLSPYLFILFLVIAFLFSQTPVYPNVKLWVVDHFSLPLKIIQFPFQEIKKVIFYRSIFQENQRLKAQLDASKRRLINQEETFRENERLRRLISFKNSSQFSLIAARIIARDPSNWDSAAIIDKGKIDGVREGLAVITELGLAGQVLEVGRDTSKVMLINDPNFSVASLLQRSREEGIVSGAINGLCRMKYLSLDSDVKKGDIVVTSELSQGFPKGLLIGSVTEAETDTAGLSKNCIIEPAVKLSKLEEVLLVIP